MIFNIKDYDLTSQKYEIDNLKDIDFHKKINLTGHNSAIYTIVEGKDKGEFFSAGGDGWIVRWNINELNLGKLVAKTESQIFSLCFFKESNIMVAGNMEGGIHFVDMNHTTNIKNVAHHQRGIFEIISYQNKILSAGGLGQLTKWNTSTFLTEESIHLSHTSLRCIDVQKNNYKYIAVGSSDCSIYIFDENLEWVHTIKNAHENSVFSVRFYPDKNILISGGRDAQMNIWDMNNFQCIQKINAHWFTINDIQFHPILPIFATASRDKTIRIWDAHNFKLLKELNTIKKGGHLNSVNRLLWLDEKHLISCSDDRTLIVWEMKK